MDDLASDFLCEAAETLGGLQAGIARLAADPADRDAAGEMLRRLHGLKGLCGFAGFARAEALVHAGESLTAAIDAHPAPSVALALLAGTIGRIGELFAFAAGHRAEPAGADAELVAALEACALGRPDGVVAPFSDAHASPGQAADLLAWPDADRRVRAPWTGLDTLAQALGDRLGKRIELVVGGDDLRIAPAAATALRTALIALVRNACDHGVETPDERRAAAKPTRSVLRLSVHRLDGGAVIEMADDGRGVDPARILAHCVASGRVTAEEAARLGAADALDLIFSAGVSTAPAVDALSGRGLGLDLVRGELQRLGGAVVLASKPGEGARFILTLPATAVAVPADRKRVAA